jgi:VWFA-related protein
MSIARASLGFTVALTAIALHAQTPGTLRFVSPSPDSYLAGPTLLRVAYDGEAGGAAIADVTFFADGQQVCVTSTAALQCEWDAGREVVAHALRAVARLKSGGRVIVNIRTTGLAFAQSVAVDIVQVNAVVTSGGRFVKGLTLEEFRLLDDKQPRPITSLAPGGAPMELVLALDVSGSMEEALPDVRRAARAFLTALGDGHQVTIIAFNDSVFTLARRESSLAARLQALDKLSAWGGTSLYDVIAQSIDVLSRRGGRKAVVVFSDGEDRNSRVTFADVRRLVDEQDATLFMIGLGQRAKSAQVRQKLEDLADASGGLALFSDDPDELARPFAQIVETLANQYTLGFEPRRDGKYHELSVEVPRRGGLRIRARKGYVAPLP